MPYLVALSNRRTSALVTTRAHLNKLFHKRESSIVKSTLSKSTLLEKLITEHVTTHTISLKNAALLKCINYVKRCSTLVLIIHVNDPLRPHFHMRCDSYKHFILAKWIV